MALGMLLVLLSQVAVAGEPLSYQWTIDAPGRSSGDLYLAAGRAISHITSGGTLDIQANSGDSQVIATGRLRMDWVGGKFTTNGVMSYMVTIEVKDAKARLTVSDFVQVADPFTPYVTPMMTTPVSCGRLTNDPAPPPTTCQTWPGGWKMNDKNMAIVWPHLVGVASSLSTDIHTIVAAELLKPSDW